MVTNFKKSFLLLITAIFFTQSLILGCSTEVDSEVKKMEEEKPDVITVVKKLTVYKEFLNLGQQLMFTLVLMMIMEIKF